MLTGVATKLVSIWKSVYVKTRTIKSVTQLIKDEILAEILHVRKGLKKILSKEHLKSKHLSKFDTLFDISQCSCFKSKSQEECIPR